MVTVLDEECAAVDVDPARVARLARRLEACAKEAKALGVFMFGGAGTCTVRAHSPSHAQLGDRPFIVAHVGGPALWDGGDGAELADGAGLMRGEGCT
jgi:hypothetical protein